MSRSLAPDARTRRLRASALTGAAVAAAGATALLIDVAIQDGVDVWDVARAGLMLITTAWLAWGAALCFVGLRRWNPAGPEPDLQQPHPRVVVLMPICNEDPVTTFARIAAIDASLADTGLSCDIAVLSDTRDQAAAETEQATFARLRREVSGQGQLYYRRRTDNSGRKAGNIEEFLRRFGGNYDFAVILDADSLMEGATIRAMVARMQSDDRLGLLQTLPNIVLSKSFFGRAMQFAAGFHGPVFTRGLARMQGATGPFWGHNAIVRVRAFVDSCGLPELAGKPPFGGHILSHDYVEAALLARAGWTVRVDPTLEGSFEEGPENILSYAKRDRRWCQGNLQHSRLLLAPGLAGWSRFVFLQGIFAYLVSLLWAGFLIASLLATVFAPAPDYFPEPHMLFPVFPSDRTREITALVLGIIGLLVLPKLAILAESLRSGRVGGYGGLGKAAVSVVAEVLLSSVLAPVMLMYQSRAVLQVLAGRDGGWPANARGEGRLSFAEALRASAWISLSGGLAVLVVWYLAPQLTFWMLPVCLPMMAAPVLIAWTSRRVTDRLFRVPQEAEAPEVVRRYLSIAGRWTSEPATADGGAEGGRGADADIGLRADVAA
ncbi:glucans biosynthesis glucosyltransferase MdoH [Pseudooceanicola sp. C21-150M6]|uniref:glucans biosynthesis glucosyltransferase MdoH n=1 Tax=Pseudooceanicola sp. C21-150M6 TaxID=3434355 RepID=UPI003D7F35E4